MDETVYRKALPSDYPGILRLQKDNLPGNGIEDAARDGFLSIEFSEKQFEEMNGDLAVIVAARGGEIAGYLCGSSCGYGKRFPIIKALIGAFTDLTIDGARLTESNTFIYGPVCVARPARGSGVLEGLFAKLRETARGRFDFCVLFISERNGRSINAHLRKLRMKDLGAFEWDGGLFRVLGAAV